jgi:hypothetical protein
MRAEDKGGPAFITRTIARLPLRASEAESVRAEARIRACIGLHCRSTNGNRITRGVGAAHSPAMPSPQHP